LLDADYSFAIARNITEHLTQRNDLPPLILVGIAYGGPNQYRLNRRRDYTPRHSPTGGYGREYQKVSGGGPKFVEFIEKDLIPFVESRYPASGERGIVGHSYGGLFASWVLLTRPGLFDVHVIVSPSLWYHDEWMFGVEEKIADDALRGRAYLAVGDREASVMPRTLVEMTERLRERQPGLAVRHEIFDDETHNSVFPTALSRGLRWGFRGR
ncbi:MAG: alpha/beta hydrolase, partial [Thermoanaerobaculia bacterium]